MDGNKEVSKRYEEVWKVLKKILKRLMAGKELNMGKILKIIKFNLMMTCQ